MTFVAIPDSIREDAVIASLSDRAGLFFLLLLTQVDAHGRIGSNAKLINGMVWPLRDRSTAETQKAIAECVNAGLLVQGKQDDLEWLQVVGWDTRYQPVGANRSKRPRSRYPDLIAIGSRSDLDPITPIGVGVGVGVGVGDVHVQVESEEKPARQGGTELTRWWDSEYQRTRGVPFDWVAPMRNGKRGAPPDAVALGDLQGQFPIEEIKRRITSYCDSQDGFEIKNCTPRMFASRYANHAVQVRPLSKSDKAMMALQASVEFARDAYAAHPKPQPQQTQRV